MNAKTNGDTRAFTTRVYYITGPDGQNVSCPRNLCICNKNGNNMYNL